jgi:hypothetical protein
MARIGDADTGEGTPKERMTRIDDGDRLLWGDDQVNWGSELIEVFLILDYRLRSRFLLYSDSRPGIGPGRGFL